MAKPDKAIETPATLRAHAARLSALLEQLEANGHYGFFGSIYLYEPPNDRALLAEAEVELGRPLWRRDGDPAKVAAFRLTNYTRSLGELRKKRAELEVSALKLELGSHGYPILICVRCQGVTGWLEGNMCSDCLAAERITDNRRDLPEVMASWQGWTGKVIEEKTYAGVFEPELEKPRVEGMKPSWLQAIQALLGRKASRDACVASAWESVACPFGEQTPPLLGAVYDVPVRYAQLSPLSQYDQERTSIRLIRFGAIPYEWRGDRWRRRAELANLPLAEPFPTTFAESEPQLAVAWEDFRRLLATINAAAEASRRPIDAQPASIAARRGEKKSGVIGGRQVSVEVEAGSKRSGRGDRVVIDVD